MWIVVIFFCRITLLSGCIFRFVTFKINADCVCMCVRGLCVRVHPRRAATVLSTLCRGRLVAMTSQVCRPSRPTTSFCPSWVRKTVDTC